MGKRSHSLPLPYRESILGTTKHGLSVDQMNFPGIYTKSSLTVQSLVPLKRGLTRVPRLVSIIKQGTQ